jgi:hypothetical protein
VSESQTRTHAAPRPAKYAGAILAVAGLVYGAIAFGLAAFLAAALVAVLAFGVDLVLAYRRLRSSAARSEEELQAARLAAAAEARSLAETRAQLSNSDAARAMLRRRLSEPPRSLEHAALFLGQLEAAVHSTLADAERSADGPARWAVVRFSLLDDGGVEVMFDAESRHQPPHVAVMSPAGDVLVPEASVTPGRGRHSTTQCLVEDLPEQLQGEVTDFGSVSPPGYYVTLPGIVAESFVGVSREQLEELAVALTEARQALNNSIANREQSDV